MSTIYLDIVSAEGELYSGQATMVFAPATQGEIGIAPRHAPLLTTLNPGAVRVQSEGEDELNFYVSGGLIEIQPYAITILADTAVRAADLDEAAVLEAVQAAEETLAQNKSDIDVAQAQAALIEAAAMLQALQRLKGKSH